MINPFLVGRTIYLSPLSRDDISERYIGWLNDPEVCRDNSHATFPNTLEKATAYVDSVQARDTELAFAVRLVANDEHVGNVALNRISWVHRSAELAILIGEKEAWNKGVGSEAYQLLIQHGFDVLNLNRIASIQTARNTGMVKVCEKNGMQKEGILRQLLFKNGEYVDGVIYSILRQDYAASPRPS